MWLEDHGTPIDPITELSRLTQHTLLIYHQNYTRNINIWWGNNSKFGVMLKTAAHVASAGL
jgi:hypothetical protein